jgi:hypothetical protein
MKARRGSGIAGKNKSKREVEKNKNRRVEKSREKRHVEYSTVNYKVIVTFIIICEATSCPSTFSSMR